VKWTGIPISVGIAPTKSLAKVANRIAKKFQDKTGGSYVIDTEEKRIKALKWLKVEDIWGIGRQFAKKLWAENVRTAYDFTQRDDAWVKKHFSIVGLRLKRDLQGIPTLDLEMVQAKKSIATTRTFDSNYTEYEQVKERVTTFAVSCAEKLRKQNACCDSLMVFVRTNRHRPDAPQYARSITVQLPFPSNSGIEVAKAAVRALDQIFVAGYQYKKAGVVIMDFKPESEVQLNLFENSDPRHVPIMKTLDKLNAIYGQQKVKLASQDPKRVWKMRQERLSPRYTTRLNDIITVRL
jgi:DNA polymerase V